MQKEKLGMGLGLVFAVVIFGAVGYFMFLKPPATPIARDNQRVNEMINNGSYMQHIKDGSYYGHAGFEYRETAIVQITIGKGQLSGIELISERTTHKPDAGKPIVDDVLSRQSLTINLPKRSRENSYQHGVLEQITTILKPPTAPSHDFPSDIHRGWGKNGF